MRKNFKIGDKNILKLILFLCQELSKKRQRQLGFSILIILICGFTEFISLGAVIPFIGILVDPSSLWEQNFVKNFSISIGYTNPSQLIFPITFLFVLSAILSTFLRLLNLWINTKLNALIGSDLTSKIYKKVISQPLEKHIDRNSSIVITTLMVNVSRSVNVITSFLQMICSCVIALSIIICIFIVNFQIALAMVILFGSLYLILANSIKSKLSLNSKLIANYNKLFVKSLQEGIGAIRDVLLNGNQSYYIKEVNRNDRPLRLSQCENKFLTNFSKFAFEGIGIIIITFIGLIIFSQNKSSSQALSLIGVFALASQRLLPALQEIFRSWGLIKSNRIDLKIITEILKEKESSNSGYLYKIPFKKSIEFNSVKFKYKSNKNFIIKGINLEIIKGQRIGIIGKTGGGKSTLIDILLGLLKPSEGALIIDGKNIHDDKYPDRLNSWRASISHVPQSIYLSDSSIAENIAFGINPELINMDKVRSCAAKAHISTFIENKPKGYHALIGERGVKLSGGQRQRLGIARALYRDPEILILDEATSALDHETEMSVLKSIYSLSKSLTIIMIAHRTSTLSDCDRVLKLDKGLIIKEGMPQDFLNLNK